MSQLTSPGIDRVAATYANRRMQREILPLLSIQHPSPNQWNPLRADAIGTGDYTLTLVTSDKLVIEILKSDDLMDQVEQIVEDAITEAALDDPEAFVTSLLADLISSE